MRCRICDIRMREVSSGLCWRCWSNELERVRVKMLDGVNTKPPAPSNPQRRSSPRPRQCKQQPDPKASDK
jgi:hypothetical protein